jgi:hypothetical protein
MMFNFLRRPAPINLTVNISGAEIAKQADVRISELLTDNNAKLQTIRDQKALIARLVDAADAGENLLIEKSEFTGYCGSNLEKATFEAIRDGKTFLNV